MRLSRARGRPDGSSIPSRPPVAISRTPRGPCPPR